MKVHLHRGADGRAPTWAETILDHLWLDPVEIGAPTACWHWRGSHDPNGYPRFGRRLVHRALADLCGFLAPQIHHRCRADGDYYLRLVARNGEILAQSEGYTRRWSARRAARKNFKGIELVEVEA